MERLILIILFALSLTVSIAWAEPPVIFNGIYAKSIASGGFQHKSNRLIRDCGATNPSAGAGIAASEGSLCQYDGGTIGSLFIKNGAADTAWVDVLTASSGWSLLGNAGTGGTAILGTTDSQVWSTTVNGITVDTYGTDGTVSSIQNVVPSDGLSVTKKSSQTNLNPAADTSTANYIGGSTAVYYDGGNAGHDYGGNITGSQSDVSHDGSGTVSFMSSVGAGASFTNGGVTSLFKGVNMNTGVTGYTVTSLNNIGSYLNASGWTGGGRMYDGGAGIDDSALTSFDYLGGNVNLTGTTTVSGDVNGISLAVSLQEDSTSANVRGSNVSISLNDDSVSNGASGNVSSVMLQDNAESTSTVNGSIIGVTIGDAAVANGINGGFVNIQANGTGTLGNVNVVSQSANLSSSVAADSITGTNNYISIQGSNVVPNVNGATNAVLVEGTADVDNLTGSADSVTLQGSAVAENLEGFRQNVNVNASATVTNTMQGGSITLDTGGGATVSAAKGLSINLNNVELSPAAIAAGGQKIGLDISDGAINAGLNYTVPGAASFFQNHYIGGSVSVASGSPTSAFGFGTNLAQSVVLSDDWTLDGAGLGFVDVGFVGSIAIDSGKTLDRWTGALGGAGNPSGSGSITDMIMFRAAGLLPQGGSVSVANAYGFQVDPSLSCLSATNCWGFYEATSAAENHMSKLAINTSSKKVANSDVALEIGGNKAFINGRMTTAQRNALSPVEGMQVYDTDLDQLYMYASGAWVAVGTGAGGDVVGPASSVDGEIALFDGTTGKLIKSATTTGIVKATSGVISAATAGTDYEVPLTFGDGLTRSINDVDCDTANGSTFGCLTSSDWTTFNNKQDALTFSDTNSIDLTNSSGTITADLELSAASADSGNINAVNSIETDGLQTQVPILVGDSGAGGTAGVAPAPTAGDAAANKYLKADGTWAVPSGSSFTSSYQYWDGGGSYGSTNTTVWRFGNQRANVGSDISCSDSAANGFSCTINDDGVYEAALCMRVNAAVNTGAGITVNGSALTTAINSIDYSQGMRGMCYIGNSNAENTCCVTRTMPLSNGDVVRAQGDGTTWNNTQRTNFSVTKIQ